jgi:transposase
MKVTTIGLDLAKNVFHVVGLNRRNKEVLRKRLKRSDVLPFFHKLEAMDVAMEACSGAHYWGRELEKQGHRAKLIPPRAVKPYVQGNKNDYNDALAIAEASKRPKLRLVKVKTVAEQDRQALHRLKEGATEQRTKLCNQIRGLLREYGILPPLRVSGLMQSIPRILEDAENGLGDDFRSSLSEVYQQLMEVSEHIEAYQMRIVAGARASDVEKRLQTIPGFGPMVSSAYHAAIGDGLAFRRGRDVSSYLGIVPRQHSSGGKTVLLGISKRGNRYVRSLLVHGARAVMRVAPRKKDRLSQWVTRLAIRRGKNKATVALANKLARIGWVLISKGGVYEAQQVMA